MVNPVHGSSPIQPGNHPLSTPAPELYNLMSTLWCTFQNYTGPNACPNSMQFFQLFQAAAIPLANYCNAHTPLDPYTQQIYNALYAPADIYGASLIHICDDNNWVDWNSNFNTGNGSGINVQLDVLFNDLCNTGCGGNDWFKAEYAGSPYPAYTPPSQLYGEYNALNLALSSWGANDNPNSSQFNSDGNIVVADILALYGTLETATKANPPTLDGYGQFLLNFLSVPFDSSVDSKGNPCSLYNLATDITAEGGVGSANELDVAGLYTALFYSEGGGTSVQSAFTSGQWISNALGKELSPPS